MRGWPWAILLALAASAPLGPEAAAQGPPGSESSIEEQDRLIREAAVLEARGDPRGAEERLRFVLDENPANATAVFSLDRILANEDRRDEMLPLVRAHLEARPESSAVRALQLRLLARNESAAELRDAVEAWIRLSPRSLGPYQEAVRFYEDLFGPERALELVREARESTGVNDALALDAGDLLAGLGREEEAVAEWIRAVGRGSSLRPVVQRIRDLPGDRRPLIRSLVEHLEEADASTDQLRAAAGLAIEAGMEQAAVDLASRVVDELDDRTRRGFLVQFAGRAQGVGAHRVALWAFERVRETSENERELRSLDGQIAELALAVGDTARALSSWERLNASFPKGSVERRRSVAATLEVEVRVLSPSAAADRLEEFRAEFPDAPELDALGSRVAERLSEAGDQERAGRLLEGVQGPRSGMHRAWLELLEGRVDAGLAELHRAVGSLSPAEATGILQLVNFLEEADERAAELGGRVAALAYRGRVDQALAVLEDEASNVSLDDRPALLALGAQLMDEAGRDAEAADLRSRLVERFPGAGETPEATLLLARYRAGVEGRVEDARLLLEDLILSRPESAVVPDARRELQRLRAEIRGGVG